ncbi:MAG TPA: serine/threonine-protein kinase, partial [bacterium]|nr:serine/threonine-protein kinase [bacterium]
MGATRRKKLQGPWAERYEILQPLGSGGAGDVYLAKDSRRGDKPVALKLLDRKRLRDSAVADSLRNEFSSLTRLSHPHLAKVWDFGASAEEMYLSTEYIEGQDLFTDCRNADLNTVFRRIVELLRGLDYLHRRGVLHLDLKPANILVAHPKEGPSGVKLIDFGLAQWTLKNPAAAAEFSGSPPYSAPELMLGGAPTPASDLYAIGMIFYRLFSAGLPFKSEDPLQQMQEQLY